MLTVKNVIKVTKNLWKKNCYKLNKNVRKGTKMFAKKKFQIEQKCYKTNKILVNENCSKLNRQLWKIDEKNYVKFKLLLNVFSCKDLSLSERLIHNIKSRNVKVCNIFLHNLHRKFNSLELLTMIYTLLNHLSHF